MKISIKFDSKKVLEILEKHVDKLVLSVIAILCLVLLWKFVIGSPYSVEQSGRKFSPGKIDQTTNQLAEQIDEKLATAPDQKTYRAIKLGEFQKKMALTVKVDTKNILNLQPGRGKMIGVEERIYTKPDIPPLTETVAQKFRTAVFAPISKVDMENQYRSVLTEIRDVDVISVQVSFDVQTLYANFERCFSGRKVHKSEWKDEQLAKPLFAAVDLQRQSRLDNGNWSQWQTVPRGKVDDRKEMLKVPEKITDIDLGGIDLLMLNYNKMDTQQGLLQPVTYDFAASNIEWLPPVLHKELIEVVEKEAKLKERELRTKKTRKSGRGSVKDKRAAQREKLKKERASEADADEAQERTVDLVRQDYDYARIDDTTDFGQMIQSLLVWAHDDTVEPDNTYRYKIRVGVFNPTAGKNWFAGKDDHFKDDIVLWSEYSPVTEPVRIDPMMYIFPVKFARGAETVTIDVAKFNRGKWRSHEFEVAVGENIGQLVEIEDEDAKPQASKYAPVATEDVETIDFSSSAILVDIAMAPTLVAPGTARPRAYYQVFMTENGIDISQLPVTKARWPKDLQNEFDEVKKAEDEYVMVSDTRGMGGRPGYNQDGGGMDGGMDDFGMEGGMEGEMF